MKWELKSLDEEIQKLSELLTEIDLKNLSDKDKLLLEETEVSAYNAKIQGMKESFRNKIIWLYKNGADYPMQVIFSSASLNQMYVRLQYLTQISRMRAKDFEKIKIPKCRCRRFSPTARGRSVPCGAFLPSPSVLRRGHDIHELTRVPFYEVSVKTKT